MVLQLGVPAGTAGLVNTGIADRLAEAAESATAAQTLATLDALAEARERLAGNVAPALALEAALISAVRPAGVRT